MTLEEEVPRWNDTRLSARDRAAALVAEMTLEEKIAQLYGVWVGASNDGGEVAPYQHEMDDAVDLDVLLPLGLGQLTRPFGSAPVAAAVGARSLARTQQRIVDSSRFGIPALAHEECLAGFATWGATAFPVPLSWGATFNPALVERMAATIGRDMRSVGIHQGLAPVLDVVRDARWGRVEETIGEDPYLVGTIGAAYVNGLEGAGIIATLKHFVGYSASKAGRNLAPVSVGPRELQDVLLPPFEMVLRETAVRSVMHSYTDVDGIPAASDASLLTTLLRDTWGFEGTVVADYFGVAFLHLLHGVAGDWGEAAAVALTAGVDVELPTVKTFGPPLVAAVKNGLIAESFIDRAVGRVLRQKVDLGLLDPDWSSTPEALATREPNTLNDNPNAIELDSADNRALAREVAEQSVILLSNNGLLPLPTPKRLAVIGPNADNPLAVLGCYSFPAHVGVQHPNVPIGIRLPTVRAALQEEYPSAEIAFEIGTSIDGGETAGIAAAVEAARAADAVVLVLGDRAGLFGRGTSGEGCDAESLVLPGTQQQLLDEVLATRTPTIVTLLSGRPYALGSAPADAAAIIQTFFPGEEGAGAIAGVVSGRVNPSGRLPLSVPASPGAQPSTYLAATLASRSNVSNIDPTPSFGFGHGLGYSSFEWSQPDAAEQTISTDGAAKLTLRVSNSSDRHGAEVVQLYLHDPVASVVRPVQRLIGYVRVELAPAQSATIDVIVPADLAAFTGRDRRRIVEPGQLVLGFGRSSTDIPLIRSVVLIGDTRTVDHRRSLHATFDVR